MADFTPSALGAAPIPMLGASLVAPALLFVLCAAGAIGMILLLPGRKEAPVRKIGGAILLSLLIILGALLGRQAAGVSAFFWIFAAIGLCAAARVVTHSKPVYSALYFVLTVMSTAGLFVLMWAEFMAVALVLIYAGAIVVTYVFVIMLAAEATPPRTVEEEVAIERIAEHDLVSREPVIASALGFAVLGVLLLVIFRGGQVPPVTSVDAPVLAREAVVVPPADVQVYQPTGGTQQLGAFLFDMQLVNVQMAALILTMALVGAILIARRRVWRGAGVMAGTRPDTIAAPASPGEDDPHTIPVYGTMNPAQKAYPET